MIDLSRITRGMDVMTSDGQRLGAVREVSGQIVFLDESEFSPEPDDFFVPLTWIIEVGDAVKLAKSREQVELEWQAGAKSSL